MAKKKDQTDVEIVQEAKDRFDRCMNYENTARKNWISDYKFANADADNAYQWPNDVRRNRELNQKPCLTINKTAQHNQMIMNDMRDNKPSPKIVPVGEEASVKSAEIYQGVIRHIEDISNADVAYQTAAEFQIQAGIGYWRILTDYASDDTMDQEIFIRRIPDPLSVFLDPDIMEQDGSDAKFGFVFENMLKKEFDKKYPKHKELVYQEAFGEDTWVDKDHIRVAEYMRRVDTPDTLLYMPDVDKFVRASTMEGWGDIKSKLLADPRVTTRPIVTRTIEWFLIAGKVIIEKRVMPGSYIPIIRVPGTETVIEGKLDRKGHTRAMKDPQRMYNYWSSSAVEALSIQTKNPWLAPDAAIEGYENYWAAANVNNSAVLPFKAKDDEGNPITPPERINPPTMPQGYMEGMQVAAQEMMMVSGQYQPSMGEPGNERSGKALRSRQRMTDKSTLHFGDNLAGAIRYTGKILIQWIPIVYDNERVLRILGDDGTESHVTVDPQAPQALQQRKEPDGAELSIFNPNVGKYDVRVVSGPSFATRREEAFDALMTVMVGSPDLAAIMADLVFRNADFPGATELSERLKRMVPKEALGEAPPPEQQQMAAQLQQMQQIIQTLTGEIDKRDLEIKKKDSERNIDEYKAESDRLKTLAAGLSPAQAEALIRQLLRDMMQNNLAIPVGGNPPVQPGVMQ